MKSFTLLQMEIDGQKFIPNEKQSKYIEFN